MAVENRPEILESGLSFIVEDMQLLDNRLIFLNMTTPPDKVYYLTVSDKRNISKLYINAQQINCLCNRAGISFHPLVVTRGDRTETCELCLSV